LIFSTTLIAQSIATAWKRNPAEGQQRVDRLLELSQTALREMRTLLFELRPGQEIQGQDGLPVLRPSATQGQEQTGRALTGLERIHRYGLLGALQQLAQDFSHEGIEVRVAVREFPPIDSGVAQRSALESPLRESIYRIVQEALNNAVKHAHARQIVIQVKRDESKRLFLSIKDDGVGFIPGFGEKSQAGGFGMNTMRERAEALGGSLQVISALGQGTTVEVMIPIREIDR
jgi:signal transduction histidine kinase